MTGRWRRASRGPVIRTGIGAALVVALQWGLVWIPSVDIARFERIATELDRTDRWRYGYVLQHHGAVFARARYVSGAPPLGPLRRADRLSALMARELRLENWKAGLELLLYAGLFVLCRVGLPRFLGARPWAVRTGLRRCTSAALSGVIVVSVAMAPYLATGYGEPLFSNRIGPGALSYSGLVPATAPITSAISYTLYLQVLLIWPLVAAEWAARPLSAWLGIRGSLWLVSTVFGAAIAALAVLLMSARPAYTEPPAHGAASG